MKETTCPKCWLDPLGTVDGERPPVEFGPTDAPDGVDCPRCGLVYHQPPPEDEERRERQAAKKELAMILELFMSEQDRGTRAGSRTRGVKKERPRLVLLEDRPWIGFPETDKSETSVIDPHGLPLYANITREIDDWLKRSTAAYRMTRPDFLRLCLEWARRHRPEVDGKNLQSKWKQRARLNIGLRMSEKRLVAEMAEQAGVKRLGHYVAMVLDLLARRSSLQVGLEEIRHEG